MAEDQTEETTEKKPRELKRYRVQLEGNRGEAVMKLTEEHAKKMGDRVLGLADSEQPDHAGASEEAGESPGAKTKGKTPANKSKAASDK